MTAHFSNVVFVSQYALRTDVTFDAVDGSTMIGSSPNGYSEMYLYSPSNDDSSPIVSDTDYYFYDSTSNTSRPAISIDNGGYNVENESTGTYIDNGDSTINGLINKILEFLSAPIKHIQNLYNSAISFFNNISLLWSWLPDELVTLLVSAISVIVIIGVIKFLWK